MKTNETASIKTITDLSDYQNVNNVVTAIKNPQEEQLKRVQPKTKDELKTLIDETIEEQGYACDLNFIDTSLITDMDSMFSYSKFNGDISSWDVSNVTNMSFMFSHSEFNSDISSWDVSNVTNMGYMFYDSEFNGDISSWDVSNVTNMHSMFDSCKIRIKPDWFIEYESDYEDKKMRKNVMRESASDRYKSIIKKRHINESGFGDDVDNIKSPVGRYIHKTDRRFQPKTKNELQILIEETIKEEGAECDLNFIDTSLIKDMSYLFYGSDFNGDISQWDVSDVINMRYMFANSEFDGDISKWDIFNVEDMTGIFDSCEIRIKPDWFIEYESDYEDEEYFYNNKYNKKNYEVKKMRKNDFMDEGFDRYKSIIKKRHINESNMNIVQPKTKDELKSLIDKTIEERGYACDLNFIDTSLITDMSKMFYYSKFNGDISSWDVSNVTDMRSMFIDSEFNGDISSWDVSFVTNMSGMFAYSLFNGDISSWNVSNVTNMSGMFSHSKKFNGDISSWDVSNVTDMGSMFAYSQFNGDISSWDVSNVTDMSCMFFDSKFNSDISSWDVSNVTDMTGMFKSCKIRIKPRWFRNYEYKKMRQSVMRESVSDRYKSIIKKRHINESNMNIVQPKTKNELKSLIYKTIEEQGYACDLNFIDTSLITDMSAIFYHSQFNGDISSWNVSNVTNMSDMFSNSKFNGDISSWNVSNVTNMSDMFSHSKFNGDISSWDVSNVTDMSYMFTYSKFNGDISSWDVSNVTNMSSMFYDSKFNGDIFSWNVSNVTNMDSMFDSCEIRIKPDWFIKYEVRRMREKSGFMDEGFVYVKTDDLINEMKQEGVREYKEKNKIPSFKEGNIRYDGKTINTLNDSTIKETLSVVKNDIKTLISELSGKLSGISKYIKPEVIDEKVTKDYIKNKCDKAQCAECLDTLAELIKLKKVLYAIKRVILLRKEKANESVTSRFSVYGRVFESDDEDDKDTEDDDKDSKKDKDTEDDEEDSEKDKDTEDDEEETVNVTALKIVVDKDAVDKCKEDMIDYGVEEDDIEILDSEDTDENVTIKVDANSIDALRKFLDNKGIDLEEELGGSIEDEEDDKDGNEETDDEDKEDEEDEFDMSEFDNIFGDEEDEEEKGEDK